MYFLNCETQPHGWKNLFSPEILYPRFVVTRTAYGEYERLTHGGGLAVAQLQKSTKVFVENSSGFGVVDQTKNTG